MRVDHANVGGVVCISSDTTSCDAVAHDLRKVLISDGNVRNSQSNTSYMCIGVVSYTDSSSIKLDVITIRQNNVFGCADLNCRRYLAPIEPGRLEVRGVVGAVLAKVPTSLLVNTVNVIRL
jgi:hypothetical protein